MASNSTPVGVAGETPAANADITTGKIYKDFSGMLDAADKNVANFMDAHTDKEGTGALVLTSSDSLQLQQLMADQSVTAQTATNVLKVVKDNITAAARNIS